MRYFAYEGADGQGKSVQGTIQAPTSADATRMLQGGGIRHVKVRELTTASVPVARPASVSLPVEEPAAVAVGRARRRVDAR